MTRLEQNLASENDTYKINKLNKDIEMTNSELQKLVYEKTKASMFRCRARWYEDGEKSSKYFFNLEKSNHSKKTMKATYMADGTLTKDPEKILKEQSRFYEHLFTSDENIQFNIQNDNNPSISDRDKVLMDRDISIDDLKHALKCMPNNKTPGCDGLPADFYKVFWNRIKETLHEALVHSYLTRELHISARRGIITLIPKKYKDINFIKNWRPLTLLNCDYKILAKALANRLKLQLENLINRDQSGFLRGRFIGENIRLILDTLEFTEEEDIPALLISLDYEKCFDRLEWSAIVGALRYFNFGENFIRWVTLLYNNCESCTTNNGYASEWFKPSRGVRQGCPLSPYLFVICAEIFANLVRNNDNIKGIKVQGKEIKLSQYADDTNIFSLFDANSLNNIISTLDYVHQNTGLKVNYDKTSIYRIGSLKHSDATLYTQMTNVKLLEWKIKDTDKCTFCIVQSETLLHLFWECQTARHVWNSLTQWYKEKTGQTVHLNSQKVLFCKPVPKPLHCLNTIVLISMQYIYASRCLEIIPNFGHLKSKILDVQNMEKYIAIKNNQLKKHEIKWKGF